MTKFMKGKKSGSYLFWLGLIVGPSIIISSYLKVSDSGAALFIKPWKIVIRWIIFLFILSFFNEINRIFYKISDFNGTE